MIIVMNLLRLILPILPILLDDDEPIPHHDSDLTGQQYVKEIMSTENPSRFIDIARMDKPTFDRLVSFLRGLEGLEDTPRRK